VAVNGYARYSRATARAGVIGFRGFDRLILHGRIAPEFVAALRGRWLVRTAYEK